MIPEEKQKKIIGILQEAGMRYQAVRVAKEILNAMPGESETLGEAHCPMCLTTFNVLYPIWDIPEHLKDQITKGKIDDWYVQQRIDCMPESYVTYIWMQIRSWLDKEEK